MNAAGPGTVRKARVADIVAVAARLAKMAPEKITGPGRRADVIRVRQACYVVARRSGHSFPQIGRLIGGRDHSSVVHGVQVAAIRAERDVEYSAFIDSLDYHSLNLKPMTYDFAKVAGEIPDKPEPPVPSLILVARKPEQRERNDFRSGEQPDQWQEFHDNVIAGSAALAAAIMGSR